MSDTTYITLTGITSSDTSQSIAREIARRYKQAFPGTLEALGERGEKRCLQDSAQNVMYLAEAVHTNTYSVYESYLGWLKTLLENLGFPESYLPNSLGILEDVLREKLDPGDSLTTTVLDYLKKVIDAYSDIGAVIPGVTGEKHHLGDLGRKYVKDLLEGRRQEAADWILEEAKNGRSVREIYLSVFQPAQREIGWLWQLNKITVAQEHYCTAATQLIMSRLYPYIFEAAGGKRTGRVFVGACVSGELHELGIRMVTDFFEMEGWDTFFLGANTPVEGILDFCVEKKTDLLGISIGMFTNLPDLEQTISAVRADPRAGATRIIVGGYPFVAEPDLYRTVGADATAASAEDAVHAARTLGL
jgi:MerR family transcriptional regulator, light-induced transcriptional regulator